MNILNILMFSAAVMLAGCTQNQMLTAAPTGCPSFPTPPTQAAAEVQQLCPPGSCPGLWSWFEQLNKLDETLTQCQKALPSIIVPEVPAK